MFVMRLLKNGININNRKIIISFKIGKKLNDNEMVLMMINL